VINKTKNLFDGLRAKISGIIERMKQVIGSASNVLKKALGNLELEALKVIGEKLDEFKLKLIANMFAFIAKVSQLANEQNWIIKEISMEMPEIGLEVAEVSAFGFSANIHIPKITQPKVSVKFTPT